MVLSLVTIKFGLGLVWMGRVRDWVILLMKVLTKIAVQGCV